ncbi:MAG: type II toxin-antitoxin system YafQ family toxin [Eubacteriales bacterium]
MLDIVYHTSFKKDLKKIKKRNLDTTKMDRAILLLRAGYDLPLEYKDHKLVGNWQGFRECHIAPDWLLVYRIQKEELVLVLCHTGSHSDIFQ